MPIRRRLAIKLYEDDYRALQEKKDKLKVNESDCIKMLLLNCEISVSDDTSNRIISNNKKFIKESRVTVTEEEYTSIMNKASELGLKLAQLYRLVILKSEINISAKVSKEEFKFLNKYIKNK